MDYNISILLKPRWCEELFHWWKPFDNFLVYFEHSHIPDYKTKCTCSQVLIMQPSSLFSLFSLKWLIVFQLFFLFMKFCLWLFFIALCTFLETFLEHKNISKMASAVTHWKRLCASNLWWRQKKKQEISICSHIFAPADKPTAIDHCFWSLMFENICFYIALLRYPQNIFNYFEFCVHLLFPWLCIHVLSILNIGPLMPSFLILSLEKLGYVFIILHNLFWSC